MKKFILLLAVVIITAGCSVNINENAGDKIKEDISSAVTEKTTEAVEDGKAKAGDAIKEEIVSQLTAKEVFITADNISPSEIKVIAGEEVRLKISSSDDKTHGFYLPDLEITETVKTDQTTTITFTPENAGTFTYSCNINCNGIVAGNLIVK